MDFDAFHDPTSTIGKVASFQSDHQSAIRRWAHRNDIVIREGFVDALRERIELPCIRPEAVVVQDPPMCLEAIHPLDDFPEHEIVARKCIVDLEIVAMNIFVDVIGLAPAVWASDPFVLKVSGLLFQVHGLGGGQPEKIEPIQPAKRGLGRKGCGEESEDHHGELLCFGRHLWLFRKFPVQNSKQRVSELGVFAKFGIDLGEFHYSGKGRA